MPIYKRCSCCGKRMSVGTQCRCQKQRHKEYDRYSRDKKSKQYYNGKEWETARKETLEMDGGIDVYLFMTEGIIVLADTVHHIEPLRDNWARRNDVNNLMSVHHDTHSLIEKKYKQDKETVMKELFSMLRECRDRRGGAV